MAAIALPVRMVLALFAAGGLIVVVATSRAVRRLRRRRPEDCDGRDYYGIR